MKVQNKSGRRRGTLKNLFLKLHERVAGERLLFGTLCFVQNMFELRKFQRRVPKSRGCLGKVDTAALSLPRGNGKSSLAGHLAARLLTPGDGLFRAGTESR